MTNSSKKVDDNYAEDKIKLNSRMRDAYFKYTEMRQRG